MRALVTVAVYGDNGEPILFDMYIDGVWHGSRRTACQCADYFAHTRPAKSFGPIL